jgi:hypothetical protein
MGRWGGCRGEIRLGRRTAEAFIAAGRRPALHAPSPARDDSRDRPSTAPRAWSVGPRPTRDEDGERTLTRPSNGIGVHQRRPRPAFPGRGGGRLRHSSLPAAGRHSMRGVQEVTIRANHPERRRPGTSALADAGRGRRPLARPAVERHRSSHAGAADGCSVHRCRPQAGTPCAGCGRRRFARITPNAAGWERRPWPTRDEVGDGTHPTAVLHPLPTWPTAFRDLAKRRSASRKFSICTIKLPDDWISPPQAVPSNSPAGPSPIRPRSPP